MTDEGDGGNMKISRPVVEGYLNCKYKGHLLLNGGAGTPHDYERVMAELQEIYRETARERLIRKRFKPPFPLPADRLKIDLCSGSQVIFDPVIEDGEVAFRLDAVCREDGRSALGKFQYIPVLFQQGETLGRFHRTLLAIGGIILGRYQQTPPKAGLVICGSEFHIRTIQFSPLHQAAQKVLDELAAMACGKTIPRLVLNDHCQQCQFRVDCREQAIKADDLSLLGRITEKQLDKYAEKGITTVTQLSYTYHTRRSKNAHPQQNPRSLPLHALAIRQKRILVVGKPSFPSSGVRIYFDAEGDFDRKFTYLLGLLIVKGGNKEMISLWANDASQQKALFRQFFDVLARYDNYALFHYGQYEAAVFRQMRAMVRPKKLVDAAIAASANVLAPLHSGVYFPTYSNGLKDIGRYLGFSWTEANASGLQSLAWRRRWELTGKDEFKQKLITYNAEDCRALKCVTEALETIGQQEKTPPQDSKPDWEEVAFAPSKRTWGKIHFVLPDFDYINKCAYFQYQDDRVRLRDKTQVKKRTKTKRLPKHGRLRPNVRIDITASNCPHCGSGNLRRAGKAVLKRQAHDLVFRPSGIGRYTIEYSAAPIRCLDCNRTSSSRKLKHLNIYCHNLRSWAMYQHIQHQVSFPKLIALCEEFFHLRLNARYVHMMKAIMAQYYRPTVTSLMRRLLAGSVIYVDETDITLRHGKGYVWVLTNMKEVVYIFRPNREAGFLKHLLAGFNGVVVSDFYTGYDGLSCLQQKCLVHLIRDMNGDLRKNPFDEELKRLIGEFGALLRGIVETIDRHGLTKQWLMKHKPKAESFIDRVCTTNYRSQVAQSYQERFSKYRGKLFVFLEHDRVSWNNNYAEHAIKQFAHYRVIMEGSMVESGLNDYLELLSVCVTCKYKDVSFLRFLLSRERDIDTFAEHRGVESRKRRMELYPRGFPDRYVRQASLSAKESGEAADARDIGDIFERMKSGSAVYFPTLHPTVVGLSFRAKIGKSRSDLTIFSLQPKKSDSANGLRYAVYLGRFSTFFEIGRRTLRKAFPDSLVLDASGEHGVGYFRNMGDVERFLAVLAEEGKRMPRLPTKRGEGGLDVQA
jgi:predicted RecB family nuclease